MFANFKPNSRWRHIQNSDISRKCARSYFQDEYRTVKMDLQLALANCCFLGVYSEPKCEKHSGWSQKLVNKLHQDFKNFLRITEESLKEKFWDGFEQHHHRQTVFMQFYSPVQNVSESTENCLSVKHVGAQPVLLQLTSRA